MLVIWFVLILTIFTVNSLWYFYFMIELLWFVMVNMFFDNDYVLNMVSYFAFILFNSLIGIGLLFSLVLSSTYTFVVIFVCNFGLIPVLSLIFNYIGFVSVMFLINYLFLKLSYFIIYLIISDSLFVAYFRELIAFVILLSLIVLFLVSISVNLVSFNLYSLVSSTFNYFILLILQTITYNSIFSFLYVLLYTYFSFILYYVMLLFISSSFRFFSFNGLMYLPFIRHAHAACLYPIVNLVDIMSLSLFSYILYTSLFIYLLLLSGLFPLFIFFLNLFFILSTSTSYFFLIILLSFIVFFLYSFSFLNLILNLS